ncbi:MAG TPA: ABC transporter substrate-binding protein, partial [Longimicrobiaceae bacterium]|nr:ABC transporter substrate-binding protein [Longimicrobiaceae bacterium]
LAFLTSTESPMALAWHYEYLGPDSASLRYRMKSGLAWSDGRPITAHDVVWTYRAAMDTTAASPRLQDVEPLDSVVAENDSTVVFHFERRYPEMLFASGLPVAPRHQFEGTAPAALRTHPAVADPARLVVSGAFRIGARTPNQEIVLVPNPRFSTPPRLERVVIRVVPDPTTRLVELETGRADLTRPVPFDQIPPLRQRAPNLRFEGIDDRYWEYVAYNPRTVPAFRDPEVRRALGMAVDVPGIIRALQLDAHATPAAGPYPPIFRDLADPQRLRPLPHDPAGARRILEEKGWRDADGDSIRERDGRPLRFTLLTNAGNQRRADVSQILQRQWRAVGAEVRLRQVEFNTFQQAQIEQSYEALLGSWAVALSPDVAPLFAAGSPLNIVSYASEEAARHLEQARAEPTAAAAAAHWRALAETVARDQPYTWLYFYDVVVGISDRLRGVRVDTYGAYQNLWEWWIPRDRQGPSAANAR